MSTENNAVPVPDGVNSKKKRKKRWSKADKAAAKATKKMEAQDIPVSKKKRPRLQADMTLLERIAHLAHKSSFTGSVVCRYAAQQNAAAVERLQIITSSAELERPLPRPDPPQSLNIYVQPLLVLDINGILCHRIRTHREPPHVSYRPSLGTVVKTPVIPRPQLVSFLQYLQQHFCVAIWTSAKAKTANLLIQKLLPTHISQRLLFCWGQDKCRAKTCLADVVWEKDLASVWKEYPLWNAHNTLLVDDSPEKCIQRTNAIHPPSLNGQEGGGDRSDWDNVLQQWAFFQQFVQHWSSVTPIIQEWQGSEAWLKEDPAHGQREFLRCRAKGHMGWRE